MSNSLDPDIVSVLIWVQTVCKGYQQTTFVVICVLFSKLTFFKKFFQEHYQSAKQFEYRPGPTFCACWVIFYAFVVFCWLFSKLSFSKNSFRDTINVSNGFYPDQDWHSVRPDQGPNCLQRLSADDKSQLVSKELNNFFFYTKTRNRCLPQHWYIVTILTCLHDEI